MNALRNNYIFPAIFILLLGVNFSYAQQHPSPQHHPEQHHPTTPQHHVAPKDNKSHKKTKHKTKHKTTQPSGHVATAPAGQTNPAAEKELVPGFNIKLSPAFYWKTVGIELEYVTSPKFSVGLNLYGQWGVTQPQRTQDSGSVQKFNFLKDGLRAELAFKYYIKGKAPEGLYIQANLAYSQINYYNGSVHPYTFCNLGLSGNTVEEKLKASPIGGGVGIGYQLIIIPKIVVANFMLGIQGNIAGDNKPFVSFYGAPSIGFLF